ncbi:MAG TPA: hypothetical protein VLR94_12320, partial [Acidobacteriota bacterium]|nr:hypothetical protein [Acidobacteriota bacterium]
MPTKFLAALFLLLFPLGTLLCAADRSEFLVYVMKSMDAGCAKPEHIPPDASLLFSGQEVEKLDWAHQTFLLNGEATKRLLTNASDLEGESKEDFVPRGQFPDSGDKSFAVVLKGKVLVYGIVAGMNSLQNPPDCPLLYPDLPMVDRGKLVLGVGLP